MAHVIDLMRAKIGAGGVESLPAAQDIQQYPGIVDALSPVTGFRNGLLRRHRERRACGKPRINVTATANVGGDVAAPAGGLWTADPLRPRLPRLIAHLPGTERFQRCAPTA